ncbi:Snx4 protein [Martiniozyma asiatica (nom. inval.)]|nr:Snx4 protein [Martiniozyma asiatica]
MSDINEESQLLGPSIANIDERGAENEQNQEHELQNEHQHQEEGLNSTQFHSLAQSQLQTPSQSQSELVQPQQGSSSSQLNFPSQDNSITNFNNNSNEHQLLNSTEVSIETPIINSTIKATVAKPAYLINVLVQNPTTQHEGTNTFTQYELQVATDNPRLPTQYTIFRRYSDFDFLYHCLVNDFPTLLIPPLPNKQRLEYIKGGRFTDEFVSKRCHSLNLFIKRILNHSILSKSEILILFLDNHDYWKSYKQSNLQIDIGSTNLKSNSMGNNIEGVTDLIMNSFKKPHLESKYSKQFKEMSQTSQKLEENLNKIDKIYTKVVSKQEKISRDLSIFGDEFKKLTILFKNDFDGKHKELEELDDSTKKIVNQFTKFSLNLKKTSNYFNNLNHYIEFEYLNELKDLEHYIFALNQLSKDKDNKILDYQVLSNYLEKAQSEKENLENGGSITATTEGAISFISKKLESLTGFRSSESDGDLVAQRLDKLRSRINLLSSEKLKAKQVFEKFEEDLLSEWSQFKFEKDKEINQSLNGLVNGYIDFYTNCVNDWGLEEDTKDGVLSASFPNKLNDNGYFNNDDVDQRQRKIDESLLTST